MANLGSNCSYLKSQLLPIFVQIDGLENKEKSLKTPWRYTSKLLKKSWKKICHDLWEPWFLSVPKFLILWPQALTYFWKKLILAFTFEPKEIGLWYYTWIFIIARPFCAYQIFLFPRIEWSGAYWFCPVCLSVVNFNLRYNFWTVRDRDFIFGMHSPLMMPFQMTPRSMTLWPWLWHWS